MSMPTLCSTVESRMTECESATAWAQLVQLLILSELVAAVNHALQLPITSKPTATNLSCALRS